MPKKTIYIIEDDLDVRNLVKESLPQERFLVEEAADAQTARDWLQEHSPDLVLLDLQLPDANGLELIKEIKGKRAAIIIVSAMDREEDIVHGLEAGADDYLTKPFSTKILNARMEAVLRRIEAIHTWQEREPDVEYRNYKILPARHEVLRGEESIPLTKSEFRIFYEFSKNPGIVFTRNQIVEIVHGEDTPVTRRSVDVLIVGLRQKLGPDGDLIETVRGIGYRLQDA